MRGPSEAPVRRPEFILDLSSGQLESTSPDLAGPRVANIPWNQAPDAVGPLGVGLEGAPRRPGSPAIRRTGIQFAKFLALARPSSGGSASRRRRSSP
eukprot:9482777-Pyramimonas_sp.AAC.2